MTIPPFPSATISSLASPETDLGPNVLVLLTCGDSSRLAELKNVHIPNNVLIVDIGNLERQLYRASLSDAAKHHASSKSQSPLPLRGVLQHLDIPVPPQIPLTNAGNSAFYVMTAFQLLVDRHAEVPPILRISIPDNRSHIYPQPGIYPSNSMPYNTVPRNSARRGSVMPTSMRRAQTMYWDDTPLVTSIQQDSRNVSSDGTVGTISLEKLALG